MEHVPMSDRVWRKIFTDLHQLLCGDQTEARGKGESVETLGGDNPGELQQRTVVAMEAENTGQTMDGFWR